MLSQVTLASSRRSRSRSASQSRARSRSIAARRPTTYRGGGLRRASLRLNVPRGVHQFVRNVNTNVYSIISGTNGILNVTSAINGGFRVANTLSSGPCMTWLFTLTAATLSVWSTGAAVLTSTNYGVPSAAEFIGLFDNFKITKIDVTCIFNKNSAEVGPDANGISGQPNILMVVDQDDSDYISIEQMLQREDMKIWNLANQRMEFSFVPRMNFLISNTAGTGIVGVGQLSRTIPYLDTNASQNSPHFGLKMVMDNATGSTIANDTVIGQLSFTFRYHLSFHTVK